MLLVCSFARLLAANHQHWSDEFYLATYIAGRNKVFAEQNSDVLQKINHHPESNMYQEECDVLKSNVARVVIIDLMKWMGFKDAMDEGRDLPLRLLA